MQVKIKKKKKMRFWIQRGVRSVGPERAVA